MNTSTNSLYGKYSRYVHGGTTETSENLVEWWERKAIPLAAGDDTYVVPNDLAQRLNSIAEIFYGEPRLWWVIALANNISDPFSEVIPGRILYVPNVSRLPAILNGSTGGTSSTRTAIPTIKPATY